MQAECSYWNSYYGLNILTMTQSISPSHWRYTWYYHHFLSQSQLTIAKWDHTKKLGEQPSTWKGGRVMDMVKEGRINQERIRSSCKPDDARKSYFSPENFNFWSMFNVHKISDNVINALKQKYPKPSPILDNTLLSSPVNEVLPCYFDNIDLEMVSKASSLTKGAGGPSQPDAM